MTRVVVVGDVLLDRDLDGRAERLAPDAPIPVVDELRERARPGGAGLAAVLAARAGAAVTLVAAIADDAPGRLLRDLLERAGVAVQDLTLGGATVEKVRVHAAGRPLVRLDRGGDGAVGPLTAGARRAIAQADAVLVSDYGRGVAAREDVRAALAGATVVWDPHPKGPPPVQGATLVTPNAREASGFSGVEDAEDAARSLLSGWGAVAVAVTRGELGALLVEGPGPAVAIAAAPAAGDPCGAGDCFAATAAAAIAAGDLPSAAVRAAVEAATAFVARGGAGSVEVTPVLPTAPAARARRPGPEDPRALAARIRAAGGTVVATGGCFDLVHAGHVRMLHAARELGDCLIVLLNSDASVRRLKGAGRPLVTEADRATVLASLACVDGVVLFEEDEPSAALARIRPHLWVKGGDYAAADLPEAAALREWGGRVVLVPYVQGRSTTNLIREAVNRAA
jgi:rfaE bifunctional protein nucleotidyltransferase chain/domain/rfaE bifunctional protein kinase chain/domain